MANNKAKREQVKSDKQTLKNLEQHYKTAKTILTAKKAAMEASIAGEQSKSYKNIVTMALSTLVGKVSEELVNTKKQELEAVHKQHMENFVEQTTEEFKHNNSAYLQLVSDYERAQTRMNKATSTAAAPAAEPVETPEKA